jgi:uncharacterized protein (UPF0335 family)
MKHLHIYAQQINHDRAYVVGTEVALRDFASHILKCLDGKSEPDKDVFYTADGEGFEVKVLPVTVDQLQKLKLPYTNPELLMLQQPCHLHPEDLIKRKNK